MARDARSGSAPFDFETSPLKPYLQIAAIKQCPSFVFVEGPVGFERACGGYGYNNSFLGSGTGIPELASLPLPTPEFETRVVNIPALAAQVHNAADKIAFADTAIANPTLIEYSFVEPPLDADGNPTSPSIHFRHTGKANVAWADGHVGSESMTWTYPTNVYGADNAKMRLGFFGPRDNTLFRR